MESPSTANRISSLLLPALLAGSLFSGLVLGAVLTHQLNSTTPLKREAVSLPSNMASKQSIKQPKSFTSLATVEDPAMHYLNASASLTYDSKLMTGFINHLQLKRPDWTWSRTELSVNHSPNTSGFSDGRNVETHDFNATSKQRLVVALDPGHGGTDPGSEAHNGLIEKELTLDMAKRVELFLSEIDNVDVVMTRSSDTGMSRQSRVNKIRAVGADVVVSLHFNHLPQTEVNLVESFYADRHNVIESLQKQNRSPDSVNLDFTSASKSLAGIMHKKVFNEVASVNKDVVDAGVKSDTLFVLTRSFTPGVLLELTCISNPAEAERLATDEYRNQLAASIADGLRDYLLTQHSDRFGEILAKLDSSTTIDQKL